MMIFIFLIDIFLYQEISRHFLHAQVSFSMSNLDKMGSIALL